MSAFRIGIVILGLFVLLAVFVKIQLNLRKSKPTKTLEKLPIALEDEVKNSVTEPTTIENTIDTESAINTEIKIEPKRNTEEQAIPVITAIASKECPINQVIDSIVIIELPEPILGSVAIAALPKFSIKVAKQIFFSGKNANSYNWEVLHPQHSYSQLRSAIQLVDLQGIISQLELVAFNTEVQQLALTLNARIIAPNAEDEIFRAKLFSHAVIPINQQLSLNLHIYTENGSWTPDFIKEQAIQLGFIESSNPAKMFFPAKSTANNIFSLSYNIQNNDNENTNDQPKNSIKQISLSLDFYQVSQNEYPFAKMSKIAVELAKCLNGKVVDNCLNKLEEIHFNKIQADLEQRYQLLNSKNIATGSAVAKRLFS